MKKIILASVLLISSYCVNAQGFKAAISAGYLSEIEAPGYSGDFIYEFSEKWGVSTNATFSVKEGDGVRDKWFALDLNARYKVYDQLYLLAGGQSLSVTVKQLGLGGGTINSESSITESFFGANLGTGYTYNLVDNINLFAEVKYVFIDQAYLHARAGILFDF